MITVACNRCQTTKAVPITAVLFVCDSCGAFHMLRAKCVTCQATWRIDLPSPLPQGASVTWLCKTCHTSNAIPGSDIPSAATTPVAEQPRVTAPRTPVDTSTYSKTSLMWTFGGASAIFIVGGIALGGTDFLRFLLGLAIASPLLIWMGRSVLNDFNGVNKEKKAQKSATKVVRGIKCPTCGAESSQRISVTNKGASAAAFGILAIGHLSKTFKCQNCGYSW